MAEKKKIETTDLKSKLEIASRDLTYISETDATVVPVFGGRVNGSSSAEMLAAVNAPDKMPVDETDLDQFFARLTTYRDWFDAREKINANGFAKLESLLKAELHNLKVLRLGKIKIDIYVIGIDEDGKVAGVKTKAIET